MAFELKDGQGSLFKNDKGDNAKRPDYRGELKVASTTYKLSAWVKDGTKGKFLSISAQPFNTHQEPVAARSASPARSPDPDDDLPF